MQLRAAGLLTVVVLSLATSACGGGPKSVAQVRSCLKGVGGLDMQDTPKSDEQITSGVLALHVDSRDPNDVLMAAAGTSSSKAASERFQDEMRAAAKQIGFNAVFESGVDGDYVWVTLGSSKNAKNFGKIKSCVEPS